MYEIPPKKNIKIFKKTIDKYKEGEYNMDCKD